MIEPKIDVGQILESDVGKNTANWIHKVVGAPIEDGVGLLFADALKEKRLRNIIKLKAETDKFIIHNQKPIPLSFAYNLLDKASLEEDESLISKWASLLANAMDKDYNEEIRKIYIDILNSIEPIDAKIINEIYTTPKYTHWSMPEKWEQAYDIEISISLDSLCSLNLIREDYNEEEIPIQPASWKDNAYTHVRGDNNGKFYLTDLGSSFINAVNRKED
jgi:hypothetical protein